MIIETAYVLTIEWERKRQYVVKKQLHHTTRLPKFPEEVFGEVFDEEGY